MKSDRENYILTISNSAFKENVKSEGATRSMTSHSLSIRGYNSPDGITLQSHNEIRRTLFPLHRLSALNIWLFMLMLALSMLALSYTFCVKVAVFRMSVSKATVHLVF